MEFFIHVFFFPQKLHFQKCINIYLLLGSSVSPMLKAHRQKLMSLNTRIKQLYQGCLKDNHNIDECGVAA
jgi:hypothetical protein